jgi:hypothetical protein
MARQGVVYPSLGWLWIVFVQMARGSMDMHTAPLVHTNQQISEVFGMSRFGTMFDFDGFQCSKVMKRTGNLCYLNGITMSHININTNTLLHIMRIHRDIAETVSYVPRDLRSDVISSSFSLPVITPCCIEDFFKTIQQICVSSSPGISKENEIHRGNKELRSEGRLGRPCPNEIDAAIRPTLQEDLNALSG